MTSLTYGVVFKSGPTLRSLLTKVKDPLPKEKLAGVVYQIPCQCGKVHVGETQRRLETRVKEHRDACNKRHVEVCHSRVPVGPATPSGLGRNQSAARPVQLKVKEVLHIERTPANNRLNRDEDYELPGCWIAKLGGGGNSASTNRAGAPPSAPGRMGARAQ